MHRRAGGLVALMLVAATTAPGRAEGVPWRETWEAAVEEARTADRPILLDAYTDV